MAGSAPVQTWTPAQLLGIRTTGHSLLVSAAAGSGKTAMLAARCAHLVSDPAQGCDVDELLVVTFTEAAAAEMKSRIHKALRERAAAAPSERLARQVALVDHAHVSTLHGFCARLLREHFHAVGLDPAFSVLDGEEAALLRREVARELFDDRYELDAAGDFHRFIDAYGEGDDARLIRQTIDAHEMLASLVDPQGWIEHSRRRIDEASQSLEAGELGRELIAALDRGLKGAIDRCEESLPIVQRLGGFPRYVDALNECGQILRFWQRTLAGEGLDALGEHVNAMEFPRLPAVSNSVPGKEAAKAAIDSVRNWMKDGPWRNLLRFTSTQWREGLAAIRPHAEVFLDLVGEFGRRYRLAKDAARAVDFSDLERFALKVLNDAEGHAVVPSRVARAFHHRFKHVLVDEYQDINEVQDAILALLSRESAWDEPATPGNLFCVGDVKQSIYRFRLAEPARFLERQRLFRAAQGRPRRGQVIDLQSNFRSRGPLLEAINGVFERLMTSSAVDIQYDQSHRLEPGLSYPPGEGRASFTGAPIEMHLLPDELASMNDDGQSESADDLELDRSEREAVLVALRIRSLLGLDGSPRANVMEKDASGNLAPRPIRFGDIVVLLRSMRYKSEQYADILRRFSIPVHADSSTGYFDSTEIRDMLALLSLLDNQRQDIPLAAFLRSPLANLANPEDAMARVRLAYPAQGEQAVAFHEAVVRYAQEKDDDTAAALRTVLAQLESWRKLAHARPLPELVWTLYQDSRYLAFCAGLHDGEQRVANLLELHRRAAQLGRSRPQTLARFMQFLQSLRDEADLGKAATASEADDVVRVMSIHRSKGLEFPVVVLPDLGKRINLSDSQGAILIDRVAGLGMDVIDDERLIRYPSLASVLVKQRLRQQALAEEMRVLYVAMTRAREHLVLIGTCKPQSADEWKSRWAIHPGPLPDDAILSARTMLDWLGPAAAASAGEGSEIIRVTAHEAEEVAAWEAQHARRPALTSQQEQFAKLRPIDPAPARSAEAAEAIERLEYRYPHEALTTVAAAEAMSGDGRGIAASLDAPAFLAGSAAAPADIGSATHRVLQHLDFRRSCDDADLEAQLTELIDRRLLSARQAALVDRGALRWLLDGEIGRLLRENAASLRRELPIHAPAPPALPSGTAPSLDRLDRVMLRGRLDVLIPHPAGAILLDYKTDDVAREAAPQRARSHAPQMRAYRRAVEQITGQPCAQCLLVYLLPRMVCAVVE